LIVVVFSINELSQGISNVFEGISVPAVHRKIREPNPDRKCRWDIHSRVEVRGPFIEVEVLRSHEIRPIPEDQVFVLLCVELE
jgi:hypothetical protein